MKITDIMTKNPKTVTPDTTIRDALGTLIVADVRHLPVVMDGKLVGILSDRDFRDYSLPVEEEDIDFNSSRARLEKEVSTIMAKEVFCSDCSASVLEIIDQMIDGRFTAVPIVEGEDKVLVGIISYIDLLEAYKKSLS